MYCDSLEFPGIFQHYYPAAFDFLFIPNHQQCYVFQFLPSSQAVLLMDRMRCLNIHNTAEHPLAAAPPHPLHALSHPPLPLLLLLPLLPPSFLLLLTLMDLLCLSDIFRYCDKNSLTKQQLTMRRHFDLHLWRDTVILDGEDIAQAETAWHQEQETVRSHCIHI